MVRHVVHSKALHNRKTLEMCLGPLTPREAGLFIPKRSVREKAQLYMCVGGVPKYLEQVNQKWSVEQNLNRLCFTANGFFVEEYETLFKEQFRSLKVYESVVASLAESSASLSELSRRIGVAHGGGFGGQLHNLVRAQFVQEYKPVAVRGSTGRRTRLYKLADPFLAFYFRYIHANRDIIGRNKRGENLFRSLVGPSIHQYNGYAFERMGEAALDVILERLGIGLTDVLRMGPYFRQTRTRGEGLQIDWLIVRRDGVWNVLEFKYSNREIGPEVIHEVSDRIQRLAPPEDITVEPVLIAAGGVTEAVDRAGFFHHILCLRDLVE